MAIKLFDSERKVMEVLWEHGNTPAKEIAALLAKRIGWNKNTTYTVIKKCIEKGAIARLEPNFVCQALITREQAQAQEVDDLIDRVFDGSASLLFASLLDSKRLPADMVEKLERIVRDAEQDT